MNYSCLLATLLVAATIGCKTQQNAATLRSDDPVANGTSPDDQLLPAYQPINLAIEVNEDKELGPSQELGLTGLGLDDGSGSDTYYMTVFGYQGQGPLNLPRNAHTYAMFVHAQGADLASASLESFLMSWMPSDGVVRLGMGVKAGRNYSFAETIRTPQQNGLDVKRTPVVRISAALYSRVLDRYNKLQAGAASGAILYKMNDDMDGRAGILQAQQGYTNCIHAISDALHNTDGTLFDTGLMHGFAASDAVYSYLAGFGLQDGGRSYDADLAGRLRI